MIDIRRLHLYIETSVWSHYYADDSPDRRSETRAFFQWCAANRETLGLYVSAYVLEEIEKADPGKRHDLNRLLQQQTPTFLAPSEEVRTLADAYAAQGALPPRKTLDALHAAMATVNEADALVSWNYRHLVNIQRREAINRVNVTLGYGKQLLIVTPPEVIAGEIQ